MNGMRWAGQVLPRLAPGQTWAATAYNAVGLLAAALVGAGLVHVLAYHLPAGMPFAPRWDRQALALLVHCPLVGPLGLIAAIAVLAPLLACWELRRLERLNATAVRLLRVRRIPLSPTRQALPRSPRRLPTSLPPICWLFVSSTKTTRPSDRAACKMSSALACTLM